MIFKKLRKEFLLQDEITKEKDMNKLLLICSAMALMYGENVFAGTRGLSEIQESQNVEFSNTDESSEEIAKPKGTSADASRFGTKDQWQNFFESQGEPQQLFFLSSEEADAIRKRKREKRDFLIRKLKSLRTQQDINLLTDKLSKLNFEDSNQKENSSTEVSTGKLIDVDDESMEMSRDSKRAKVYDSDQWEPKNPDTRGDSSKFFMRENGFTQPDAQQRHRIKIKKKPSAFPDGFNPATKEREFEKREFRENGAMI